MVESINLSIDYVPVRKYDYIRKHCGDLFIKTKQLQEQIKELEIKNKDLDNALGRLRFTMAEFRGEKK